MNYQPESDSTARNQNIWNQLDAFLKAGTEAQSCLGEGEDSVWALLSERIKLSRYRPEVIQNVEWAEIKNANRETVYMLRNENNQKYLSMGEREVFIWNLIDGKNTVEDIHLSFLDQYGFLGNTIILELLHLLRINGFLTENPLSLEQMIDRRLAGKGLWVHLQAIMNFFIHSTITTRRADAYFDRLYHCLGPLIFNRIFYVFIVLALSVNSILSLYYVFVRHESMLLVPGQAGTHDIIAMMVIACLSLALHESAHGMTVKHYGRHVSKAGFVIVFGSPFAYVDTTDIWMRDRCARIAVSFAGPCINGVIAGILLGISWFVSESFLENVLIHAGLLNNLIFLINLLPIFETDGHYIIQDWFELPRLRPEALAFICKGMWIKLFTWQKWKTMDFARLLYGTLAGAGLVFLVSKAARLWYSTARYLLEALLYRPAITAEIALFLAGSALVMAVVKQYFSERDPGYNVYKCIEKALRADP